jgi:hypothetical protein
MIHSEKRKEVAREFIRSNCGEHSKKRVAVCLSGHFRGFYNRQKKWEYFLSSYDDVDIFIHTWKDDGTRSTKTWVSTDADAPLKLIRETLNPKKMVVEDLESNLERMTLREEGVRLYFVDFDYLRYTTNDFSRNINSQLYSINRSFDLIDEPENYDLVIRLRADMDPPSSNFFLRNPDCREFLKDDVLFFDTNHIHPGGGGGCTRCDVEFLSGTKKHESHDNDLCDVMYYGNYDAMSVACRMYEKVPGMLRDFSEHNDEALLDNLLKSHVTYYSNSDLYLVRQPHYEELIKCFYPERLLREVLRAHKCYSDISENKI